MPNYTFWEQLRFTGESVCDSHVRMWYKNFYIRGNHCGWGTTLGCDGITKKADAINRLLMLVGQNLNLLKAKVMQKSLHFQF